MSNASLPTLSSRRVTLRRPVWHDDIMMAILDREYAEIRRSKRDRHGHGRK
jgi:hypothetical protein